jgi:hypothetical protein
VTRQKHPRLPFKLTAQPKSVQRAYHNFVNEYGAVDGTRIFLAKADERGTGSTPRQKVLSIYTKGAKLDK